VLEILHEPYILLGVCTLKWILTSKEGIKCRRHLILSLNTFGKLVLKKKGKFEHLASKSRDQNYSLVNQNANFTKKVMLLVS